MQAAASLNQHRVPAALVTAALTLAAFAAHIGVREFSSLEPGAPLRLGLTAALVAAFAVHILVTARAMATLDEFQRAVHMSAVSVAFPISMVALFAIGFFRAEGLLGELDARDLAMVMVLAYGGALAWAWRRYES